jgi:hypothetical protein
MNNIEFRAFLDLLMCSDPWPVAIYGTFDTQKLMEEVADRYAQDRGYERWIDAYHSFTI